MISQNLFRIYLLLLCFIQVTNSAYAQQPDLYDQVKANVTFPYGFDKVKADEILTTVTIAKLNLIRDGKITQNKDWDNYLNAIANKLLQNESELLKKIKVSSVNELSANAISFIDGSIYLNQGLIIHLQTEAEIAFIVAHEIAHVMKQHALKEIELQSKIIQAEINTDNAFARNYRHLSHSKENEYEADGIALKLIIQAGYNPTIGIKALTLLDSDTRLFPRINVAYELSKQLNNSLAQLDSTEWIKDKRHNVKSLLDIEVESTDKFSTHPDIGKRLASLFEQLKIYEPSDKNLSYLISDSINFRKLQHQLSVLALNTAMNRFEYQTAIMLILTNKFNWDSELRNTTLLKSLYFIAQAKENKFDDELLKRCTIKIDSNMVDLNKILYAYNNDKFKKLVYGYAKKLVDSDKIEEYYFYYGLCNEVYLGKQTSQIIFQNLLTKFPDGKYVLVTRQKLANYENK